MRKIISLDTPADILNANGCFAALQHWYEQAEQDLSEITYTHHAEAIKAIFEAFEAENTTRFPKYDEYKNYAINCLDNPAKTLSFYSNLTLENIFQELKFSLKPPKLDGFFVLHNKIEDKEQSMKLKKIHRKLEIFFREEVMKFSTEPNENLAHQYHNHFKILIVVTKLLVCDSLNAYHDFTVDAIKWPDLLASIQMNVKRAMSYIKQLVNKGFFLKELERFEKKLNQHKMQYDTLINSPKPAFDFLKLKRKKHEASLCSIQDDIKHTENRCAILRTCVTSASLLEDIMQTICRYLKKDTQRLEALTNLEISTDTIAELKNTHWIDDTQLAAITPLTDISEEAISPTEGFTLLSQIPEAHTDADFIRTHLYLKLGLLSLLPNPGELRRGGLRREQLTRRARAATTSELDLEGWRTRSPSPTIK